MARIRLDPGRFSFAGWNGCPKGASSYHFQTKPLFPWGRTEVFPKARVADMSKTATFSDIAKMLRDDPERFASTLLGEEPTNRTGTSVRYLDNQSIVVNTSGSGQGRFYVFTDDEARGDMLDMVRWHHGLPDDKSGRHQALEIAKSHLGITDNKIDPALVPKEKSREEKEREISEDREKRIRTANWLWDKGSATEGREEGMAYLAGRGITCEISSDTLRFRRLSRQELEKMDVPAKDIPATPVVSLIFAARNEEGQVTAVQQVLTTNGKKVAFENPKRTNGYMPGSSVMLGDPSNSDRMALVEGPETALSVFQSTGIPTQITLGSSNFTKVKVPDHVRKLVTVADMEPSGVGLCSALKTAQFWSRQGIEQSGIAIPPRINDGDYNDVHQKFGERAVQHGIDTAYYPPRYEQDGTILITPDARAAFWAWAKTGVEVAAKLPPKDKDGKYRPFSMDNIIEPRHNRVLLVKNPAFEFKTEGLRKARPDLEIATLHEDLREFRKLARQPGAMSMAIRDSDVYAPKGPGTDEPVFFSLRRDDADALKLEGHKSIAVRATSVDEVDLSFMKGRQAIVAPLGTGTEHDQNLTRRLAESGAETTRLTWQIFRGDEARPRVIRKEIPVGFGAREAAREGWTGEALKDLVDISRVNQSQMQAQTVTTAGRKRRMQEER